MRNTLLLLAVWSVSVCSAAAQTVDPASPRASLDCFVRSMESGLSNSRCADGIVPVEAMMIVPNAYDASDVQEVAAGLEDLALNSQTLAVRVGAVAWLGVLGVEDEAAGRPLPGSVERLIMLYEQTNWPETRDQIVQLMPKQQDRATALQFLADAARSSPPNPVDSNPAGTAIWVLSHMGSDGIAVLRQLQDEGSVTKIETP